MPTSFTAIKILSQLALRRKGKSQRRGVTLLELILALSLSVLIMAAIGYAIELHLKTLQTRKTHVEEAQLGRQVLRRMADDLRSAVQYQVIDFSSVEALAASSGAGLAQAASQQQGANAGSMMSGSLMNQDSGLNSSLLSGLTEEKEPVSISGSAAPPKIPGLYGTQFELQIDISRLPRVDEYQSMLNPLSGKTVGDIPSDVKTVAYYLQPDITAGNALGDPSQASRVQQTGFAGKGLVRREVDRAVSIYAAANGNADDLLNEGQMLAAEVTGLEFRYFDGTEWLPEWNSDERQGLPVAVEIAVEVGGDASSTSDETQTTRSLLTPSIPTDGSAPAAKPAGRMLYRMVVHMPAGEATQAGVQRFTEPTEEELAAAAANGGTGATGQGQGATGQANQQGGFGGGAGGFGGGAGGQGGRGGQGQGQRGGQGGQGGQGGGFGGGQGGRGGQQGGGRGGQGGGAGGMGRGGGGQNPGGGRGGFGGGGGGQGGSGRGGFGGGGQGGGGRGGFGGAGGGQGGGGRSGFGGGGGGGFGGGGSGARGGAAGGGRGGGR
jgi:hypothetical protein